MLQELGVAFAGLIRQLDDDCARIDLGQAEKKAVLEGRNIIETISIHYRSIANQVDFIELRDSLVASKQSDRKAIKESHVKLLGDEIELAKWNTL